MVVVCSVTEALVALLMKINVVESILLSPPPLSCTWAVVLYTNEYDSTGDPAVRSWVPTESRKLFELKEPRIHTLRHVRTDTFVLDSHVEEPAPTNAGASASASAVARKNTRS